jgi:hypothetical protein
MSHIVGGFLALELGLSVVAAEEPGHERRATPACSRSRIVLLTGSPQS